ncbi:MAG TPA: hypothetical protein PLV72_00645 [Candidatus Magasanikbacteria bacterium]|nr:hypothetical protein [Candidatus Magasanikbacteria bacterium]
MKRENRISIGDLAIAEYGNDKIKKVEINISQLEKEIDLLRKKFNQIRSFEIEGDIDEVGDELSKKLEELKIAQGDLRALANRLDLKK